MKILSSKNPRITFSDAELFVDNEKKKRSGHLGHAMVECRDGSILAFYPNVSHTLPENYPGHSMHGWMEYRRSHDRGITWGDSEILKYSMDEFLEGFHRIGCEKAVVCDDGTIVLFCLRSVGRCFEPYATPTCLRSFDNGETWSEPIEVSSERGRIYDALYRDGRIYVLEFCNSTEKGFFATEEGLFYKIFASDDNGESFYEYSTIPFNTLEHTYGNMIFRQDGSLVFYSHNRQDEDNLTCLVSEDNGKTWSEPMKSPTAKGARNPQVGYLNGSYILHGRGKEMKNFILYHSDDAIHWDDGTIVSEPLDGRPRSGCYYSNNIVIKGADGIERMLIQYSEQFVQDTGRVNVMHAWVECDGKS